MKVKRTNLSVKECICFVWCHFIKVIFVSFQCRLIVNCMSQTRCQAYNWLLTPLIAIVIGVCTMRLGVIEVYLLYAYTIFATAAHLHYGVCVVSIVFQDYIRVGKIIITHRIRSMGGGNVFTPVCHSVHGGGGWYRGGGEVFALGTVCPEDV